MISTSTPITRRVLKRIVPTPQQRMKLDQTIEHLKEKVKQQLKQYPQTITIQLVGSTAKDTYLSTNLDIDLFICFPQKTTRTELETIGLSVGRALLTNTEECYAEHPYVRGEFQGYKTELVPCYQIQSADQKLSAVDRTPLHTKYIIEHLKPEQKNEVRLLKQFLTGINCYGAEAEIEGFSGYLCELLILNYNTFENLIKTAQHWTTPTTITLAADTSFPFDTPLIVLDPVDPTRNVSSAVSSEKYNTFVTACTSYTATPSETFFYPNPIIPWSLKKIKKTLGTKRLIGITAKKPAIIAENLHPQVRKAQRALVDLCTQHDFIITDSFHYIDTTSFYILLLPQDFILPQTTTHLGPPIKLSAHVKDFLDKWANHPRTITKPYIKNNRYFVDIKREYREITPLISDHLFSLHLGKHLDQLDPADIHLLDHSAIVTESHRLLLTEFLDHTPPWER